MRRLMLTGGLLLVLLLAARPDVTAHAQTDTCDSLPSQIAPRLINGERGRVLPGHSVNLRAEPSLDRARLGYLTPVTPFSVLEGPICADGYAWWQISADVAVTETGRAESVTGWMAEADPVEVEYWLEPRGERLLLPVDAGVFGSEDAPTIPRPFVQLPDGTVEREGCLAPPEDYERVQLGWATLNRRTLAMLDHAQRLFDLAGGSPIVDFRAMLTQGSYNAGGVSASFGTHDGGGAVDLSVRNPTDFTILGDSLPGMIDALRVAGFAAWVRETGELSPTNVIHIHAIAVGDAELSPAARAQIDGELGYLRGYNGLPEGFGGPALDRYGEPVVCAWMVEAGFPDLRDEP